MKFMNFALTAIAVAVVSAPAYAADITITYDIQASGFAPSGAPVDPVTEIVTVTFDPSATVEPTTTGVTIDSFNLPYATKFSYDQPGDLVTFATNESGPGGFGLSPDSYGVFIMGATSGSPYSSIYQYETDSNFYSASTITITEGVPEPTTWTMILIGLGGIGATLRRRPAFLAT